MGTLAVATGLVRSRVEVQSLLGVLAAAGWLAVGVYSARWGRDFPLFWAFGLAFGFVLQRSRFCFASAFRDLFLFGASSTMKAVLAGMAVATLGFGLLQSRMVPSPGLGAIAPEAHVFPLGPHLVLGGIAFGVGMVLSGGCVSGTLYRMGEGYLGSYPAFAGILAGLGLAAHSWNFWWSRSIAPGPVVWLPDHLGYFGALAVTLLGLAGAWLAVEAWEARTGLAELAAAMVASAPTAPGAGGTTAGDAHRGAVRRRLTATWQRVFRRGWPALAGGVALGVLNVYLYMAHMPWGVTGELSRWAVKLYSLAGWAPGPLVGVDQLSGCTLTLGGSGLVSHSLMLDAGMLAGSLTGALLSGEFHWRLPPRRRRWAQALAGGVLMGYGAGIAGGCTIGAFFSAIPSFGVNGWLFGLSLLAGAGVGTRLVRWLA